MRLNGDKSDAFIWNCKTKYDIGKLAPKAIYSTTLNIVPTQPGLVVSIKTFYLYLIHFFKFLN